MQSQASRPEQSVMQALESLTETQVRDCLSVLTPRLYECIKLTILPCLQSKLKSGLFVCIYVCMRDIWEVVALVKVQIQRERDEQAAQAKASLLV